MFELLETELKKLDYKEKFMQYKFLGLFPIKKKLIINFKLFYDVSKSVIEIKILESRPNKLKLKLKMSDVN